MHTATISRIAVDAGGDVVATGSWDKTVRVWDLRSGRLMRTIHLPAGSGNEGQVYALAITPNGNTIAAGGWTGWDWEGTASVYLFDRQNGHLVRRIQDLPGRPIRLAYSPDGRWLAAGLRGPNGIRLFDPSGKLVAEDRDYGDDSSGVAFGAGGKLATSSRDGFLRLYALPSDGQPLRLLAKRRVDERMHPFGVAFSPDGQQIAVGLEDAPAVAVVSGADLTPVRRVDTSSITNGNLASVAWSANGKQLYAGGRSADRNASRIVRIWSDRGAGPWHDVAVSSDTVMDLAALPAGGFVFAAGDPAWGRVSSGGDRQFTARSNIADYRGERDRLMVSADGLTVQFEFRLGTAAARYSIAERALVLQAADVASLHRPRTAAPGLQIDHWENTSEPSLNGHRLTLERSDEMVRCVAAADDGAFALVGTDWNLDLFDRDGVRRWSMPAPDVAWAVNISSDSSLAIAAFADGTIRWYRVRDGQELFALFPDPAGKWILWTASGYYDCSPGAEGLIGWSVNRGKDNAADFFPVSQFRSIFYRPELIASITKTRDEIESVRLAKESGESPGTEIASLLPPVVDITYPTGRLGVSARELAVFYEIRSPSGEPVTSVSAFVNGRPVPAERMPGSAQKRETGDESVKGELTIPIPAEDAEISIVAANRFTKSEPETRSLEWKGPKTVDTDKPDLYLLAIGVGRYRNLEPQLKFPARDAEDIAAVLKAQAGLLYKKVEAKTLRDDEATHDAVLQAFQWIRDQKTKAGDSVIFFIAGHGAKQHGQYYFLPYDADVKNLASTAISAASIEAIIGTVPARAVLFADTCHSGSLFAKGLTADVNGAVNELSSPEHGIVVFAASTGGQRSWEDKAWGNGAFTKALVEGLSGRGQLGREITIAGLESYISRRVIQITAGRQTPATAKPFTIPDFPIALQGQ